LAGLAAGSRWHRSATFAHEVPPETSQASSALTANRPSSAPPPAVQSAPTARHWAKQAQSFKAGASALHAAVTPPAVKPPVSGERAMQAYAALPMSFEANKGQSDPHVKFLARGPGYTLFLTEKEAVLTLPDDPVTPLNAHSKQASARNGVLHRKVIESPRPVRSVRLKFVGASTPKAIDGRNQLPGKTNYFIGNDPKEWHTNVPTYSAVAYSGLYAGVDAVFHGDNQRLEFDYNVAPGADPHAVALQVEGAQRIRLNRAGDVLLGIDAKRDVVMGKPHIYQQTNAGPREVEGHYVLTAGNRITFAVGPYDHAQALVIDPIISYSTYLGGSLEDFPFAIAADSSGSAYVVGETYSSNYPTTSGSYQPSCLEAGKMTCPPGTAYVTKLSPDGSSLIYSTFINDRTSQDYATGVAVDSSGSAYVLGAERGEADFPTTANAYQRTCNGGGSLGTQMFVAKLDPTGSTLEYSTCLMNSTPTQENLYSIGDSTPGGIAVDSSGDAYVTGSTDLAQDFPTTPGTIEPNCVEYQSEGCLVENDPFVVELNPAGTGVYYSTFLSVGAASTSVTTSGIAVDSLGDAYVIGEDNDSGFPAGSGLITTQGSYLPTCTNACGGFVAEINSNGTALVYSTYLANVSDYVNPAGIAVDQNGEAYVTGYTDSTDLATTPGVLQGSFTAPGASMANGEDGFVIKMAALGKSYVYATYLSGMSYDTEGGGIGVDAAGDAFVTGIADQGFPTTPLAWETTAVAGPNQAFFAELDPNGATLLYSTYLAGTTGDSFNIAAGSSQGVSYLATDPLGNAYVIGQTESPNFATTSGAYERNTPIASGGTGATGFVVKFTVPQLAISPGTLAQGSPNTAYSQINLSATGGLGIVTFRVTAGSLPNGMTLTSAGVLSGTPTQNGTFPITVTATDTYGDTGTKIYSLQIGCPTITVGPTTLAPATDGVPYSPVTFTATGGVSPIMFGITPGSLPSGFNFVAGVLSGKATTQTGSFPLVITATDSNGCMGTITDTLTINAVGGQPAVVMDNETITVTDTVPDDPETIAVTDTVLVSASSGSLTQTITFPPPRPVVYGSGAIALSATASSSLPVSFSLVPGSTGGALSGANSNILNITGAGLVRVIASQGGNSSYAPASSVEQDITILPATLIVTALPATRTYEGPDPTFTTSITGLVGADTLTNVLIGSPTFSVASDLGTTPAGTNLTVDLNVGNLTLNSPNYVLSLVPSTLTVVCCQVQAIAPASVLPAGFHLPVSTPLSLTATASSGLPLTYTVISGPGVINTDPAGGFTLTATGSTPITVQVNQAGNNNVAPITGVTFTVNGPVTINPGTIVPAAVVSAAYGPARFTASGGTAPYTWSATGLPPGLTIGSSTGIVSGIPNSAAGSPYSVVITVTDSLGSTASIPYTITVLP